MLVTAWPLSYWSPLPGTSCFQIHRLYQRTISIAVRKSLTDLWRSPFINGGAVRRLPARVLTSQRFAHCEAFALSSGTILEFDSSQRLPPAGASSEEDGLTLPLPLLLSVSLPPFQSPLWGR